MDKKEILEIALFYAKEHRKSGVWCITDSKGSHKIAEYVPDDELDSIDRDIEKLENEQKKLTKLEARTPEECNKFILCPRWLRPVVRLFCKHVWIDVTNPDTDQTFTGCKYCGFNKECL